MRSTQTKKAICLRKARFLPCLPFIYRFFSLPNRAENLRYQNWTNKNSCRSSAKLSAWWAHFVRSFLCLRKARFSPCLPFIYRFFSLPNRAENLRYQNWTNKNSCRSSAKLSAWWVRLRRKRIKRTLIQGVLINGMCNFKDGTRAATAARKRTPSLTYSTSERTSLDSFRPRTSGIKRER